MVFDKKAYMKEWREKNKKSLKEQRADWGAKNKDHVKQYNKQHAKTPNGIKYRKIADWKRHGIQCNDEWEEVYEWYSETANCNICDKLFLTSKDKCLDHHHHLEGYNIRGILCNRCNYYKNEL